MNFELAYRGWAVSGGRIAAATNNPYNRYTRTFFLFPQIQYQASVPAEGAQPGDWCKDGIHQVGEYVQWASRWAGGAADDTGTTWTSCAVTPANYRVPLPGGTNMLVDKSRATRIGFAIAVSGAYIGATSGYSTNVTMNWIAKAGTRGILVCGKNDIPTGNPGVIYIQNR